VIDPATDCAMAGDIRKIKLTIARMACRMESYTIADTKCAYY
jgi:hypothetical protein